MKDIQEKDPEKIEIEKDRRVIELLHENVSLRKRIADLELDLIRAKKELEGRPARK
jgi:hypothetical protein